MGESPRIPLPTDPSVPKYGTAIDFAVESFAVAARKAQSSEPRIVELVRLRCASHHDCRLCRSLRTDDSGVDEADVRKIDDYENSDLDDRAKAALLLTDGMIIDPRGVTAAVAARIREHLSPREIAELLLLIVKYSQQKASVALRIEPAPRDGLSVLTVDADGRGRVGTALV